MDAITNAISDSCMPIIVPNITLQTIEDKTLIIVEISEGKQRPYYIRSLGIEKGVFIRVSGTTRVADDYMIKELMFEGTNRYFDQAPCPGLSITDSDIMYLCESLKRTALRNCKSDEEKSEIKDVTKNTLLTWGVLVEHNNELLPTNAFALLSGNQLLPTVV